MPAVITNAGAALMAQRFAAGQAMPIDSVRVGDINTAQYYDAGVAATALIDTAPVVLTPPQNVMLIPNMGQVQIDVSDSVAANAYEADEIGFMSGTTLVFLVAQASGPYYRKVANTSVLFSLDITISGSAVTSTSITVPTYSFATQPQAEAGVVNNVMMSPLRSRQALQSQFATQAEAEAGTDADAVMTALRVSQAIEALLPQPDVQMQIGAGSSTWTKPAGATTVRARTQEILIAGGHGGGSGGYGQGGQGGQGGEITVRWHRTIDLPATALMTAGAGGAGLAGMPNARPGSPGAASSFGVTNPLAETVSTANARANRGGNGGAGAAYTDLVQNSAATAGLAGEVALPGVLGAGGTGGAGGTAPGGVPNEGSDGLTGTAPGGGGGGGGGGGTNFGVRIVERNGGDGGTGGAGGVIIITHFT